MSKKWNNMHSSTMLGGLSGGIEMYDDRAEWEVRQNISAYLEQAKFDRENAKMQRGHVKKFATIPDVIAIKIMEEHGIDIHDPETIDDADKMKKFKYIIQTEYKHLMAY